MNLNTKLSDRIYLDFHKSGGAIQHLKFFDRFYEIRSTYICACSLEVITECNITVYR